MKRTVVGLYTDSDTDVFAQVRIARELAVGANRPIDESAPIALIDNPEVIGHCYCIACVGFEKRREMMASSRTDGISTTELLTGMQYVDRPGGGGMSNPVPVEDSSEPRSTTGD